MGCASSSSKIGNEEELPNSEAPGLKVTIPQPLMGVRIKTAPHAANQIFTPLSSKRPITTFKTVLSTSCNPEFQKIKDDHIIQASFEDLSAESPALAARNGFVHSVLLAYNEHHHLVIRPEDVWFSILVQINVYINAHAEELRTMFVSHEGQKELKLEVGKDPLVHKDGTMFNIDWASFAYLIGKKIEENIVDPSLRDWFMPTFTTTTKVDQATASIIMMSAMQKFFTYGCCCMCGIPTVTLLGQRRDWENILSRLERLKTFGEEPTQFYKLLKPVIQKFIESFDDPESDAVRDFWERIFHIDGRESGVTYLCGWISAFCFWAPDGTCLYPKDKLALQALHDPSYGEGVVVDNVHYHRVDIEMVPSGYASVPVFLETPDARYDAEMIAGSFGMIVSSSGLECADGTTGFDTIQSGSGWCMYEVESKEELAKRKSRY